MTEPSRLSRGFKREPNRKSLSENVEFRQRSFRQARKKFTEPITNQFSPGAQRFELQNLPQREYIQFKFIRNIKVSFFKTSKKYYSNFQNYEEIIKAQKSLNYRSRQFSTARVKKCPSPVSHKEDTSNRHLRKERDETPSLSYKIFTVNCSLKGIVAGEK